MSRKMPIFYSALMLTGVNLLLRFVGTTFQVYLSGKIGAEGIGLLQLVLSVGSLTLVAGMGGIRTATMYLTAEETGKGRLHQIKWVLAGCIRYSFLFSFTVAILLYSQAPLIASKWIGEPAAIDSLRLMAAFLPVNCFCGVMTGYFTGSGKIGTLTAIEVIEQGISLGATMFLLSAYAKNSPSKACLCVILGSGTGACFTLISLTLLRVGEKSPSSGRQPMTKRLLGAAIPLAIADNLRTGISTAENLIVPKRLSLYPGVLSPLAAFGTVCGMVFPILMFPAALLFGLTELLVPELAQSKAAGKQSRVYYLTTKSLRIAFIFGIICSGVLYLSADDLCYGLYRNRDAGLYLRWYAPLAAMLYCDIITDSVIKGLGYQKVSVAINILTNTLDIILLFYGLPLLGLKGYFVSFFITHFINFILSILLLSKVTGYRPRIGKITLSLICSACCILCCQYIPSTGVAVLTFILLTLISIYLCGVVNCNDLSWLKGLLCRKKMCPPDSDRHIKV